MIREFFRGINNGIRSANNKATLDFYKRKAQSFKEEVNGSGVKSETKRKVNREYKKTCKLIASKNKKFKHRN